MTKDNMKLWDAVSVTDPDTTRKVNQRGGFTAICAQAQLKAATKLWGPYGDTWGLAELQWEYIKTGDTIFEVALTAEFYYPGGSFPMSNDMAYKVGNEIRKKLITDMRSKCLSTLGFNSDVFEGRFDDNRYVAQVRNTINVKGVVERATDAIAEATTKDKLDSIKSYYATLDLPKPQLTQLNKLWDARLVELAEVV
jgi:hypothetical protein